MVTVVVQSTTTANKARKAAADERRQKLAQQFAPRSRKENVTANAADARRRREFASGAASVCHACGGPRVRVCKCSRHESQCALGHTWYWCEEHGRRVNHARNDRVPCGHTA